MHLRLRRLTSKNRTETFGQKASKPGSILTI
jgi:hypothetical protein